MPTTRPGSQGPASKGRRVNLTLTEMEERFLNQVMADYPKILNTADERPNVTRDLSSSAAR